MLADPRSGARTRTDGRYAAQADLLHTWRTRVAGCSQATVVAELGVSAGLASMWETGARRISIDHLRRLDALYGAEGALVDLTSALDTPRGLPPRTLWAHNPQGPSRPHWAWLRPRPGEGRVDALLLWGAFAFDCSAPCDDRGFFVTSPVSMPNPPVWVHLRRPGWVDFGQGRIPEELGVPAFEGLTVARLSTGGHSPVGLVDPVIVERFRRDPRFADAVVDFFGMKAELIRQVFSATEPTTYVADLTGDPASSPARADPPPSTGSAQGDPARGFDGPALRALREARGLSQADAAQLATDMLPDHPVSEDQIRVLERGGKPRPRLLRSRLDAAYRADGVTVVEEVPVTGARPPFTIELPTFWIGPVWAELLADDPAPGRVHLAFGRHRKDVFARPGT
ncbi:MAG TPA: helix-turn-helix transcriptional regulator, partial [Acidimicrobiales bacterium]